MKDSRTTDAAHQKVERWIDPFNLMGLRRSPLEPASDCTATCILVFGYFLNAYLGNA